MQVFCTALLLLLLGLVTCDEINIRHFFLGNFTLDNLSLSP